MKQHWYLVAYDISNQKRLQRFHRWLLKQGISVQRSVFAIALGRSGASEWMKAASELLSAEDDLRLYPLKHCDSLWQYGIGNVFLQYHSTNNTSKRRH